MACFCALFPSPGADPNCRDANGWTPLHNAAWTRQDEVTKLLLAARGIDVEAVGKFGLRAVHLATSRYVTNACTRD